MADLTLPPHLAEQKRREAQQRPVAGLMAGAWKSYVNPATIVMLRVFNVGNAYAVFATVATQLSDQTEHNVQMTDTFATEDEAGAEMDRLAGTLWAVVEPVKRPTPDIGPVT